MSLDKYQISVEKSWKIKIRTGRGTGTIKADSDPSKWSGDEFKNSQQEKCCCG